MLEIPKGIPKQISNEHHNNPVAILESCRSGQLHHSPNIASYMVIPHLVKIFGPEVKKMNTNPCIFFLL